MYSSAISSAESQSHESPFPRLPDAGLTNRPADEMALELHPLCTLFPRMSDSDYAGLKSDIEQNGLFQPIVMFNGMILDGGNRYRACLETGTRPKFVEYSGENPVTYVLSANLHRRHLSEGQHAALVSSCQNWATAQSVGKPKSGNVTGLQTVADRRAISGTSDKTQRMADAVVRESQELAAKVIGGEISLPKAYKQISSASGNQLPKEQPPVGDGSKNEPSPSDPEYTELDMLKDQVHSLQETVHEQQAIIAIGAFDGDRDEASRIIEELTAENKSLRAQLAAVTKSRDGYMNEANQKLKQIKMLEKKLKQLEK